MSLRHMDLDCDSALIRLNDAICTFERDTGREYLLVLIPIQVDEEVHVSQDGKPLARRSLTSQEIKNLVDNALRFRG